MFRGASQVSTRASMEDKERYIINFTLLSLIPLEFIRKPILL